VQERFLFFDRAASELAELGGLRADLGEPRVLCQGRASTATEGSARQRMATHLL